MKNRLFTFAFFAIVFLAGAGYAWAGEDGKTVCYDPDSGCEVVLPGENCPNGYEPICRIK